MRRIVDYKAVSGTFLNIAKYVRIHISDGWQPLGGLTWIGDDKGTGESYLAQAMVRYDTEGDNDHETDK